MPFIPMNLDEAQEAKPVPPGKYDLVIGSCEVAKTKAEGKPQFKVLTNIDGHDDAPPIFTYVQIPSEMDEPDKAKNKALMLRRFLVLFGVHYDKSGFDPDLLAMEMPGSRASNVELRIKEYEGNLSNEMVIPRLKAEESPGGMSAGQGRAKPPKRG